MKIAQALEQVYYNIEQAKAKAPNPKAKIELLAVSKTQPIEAVNEANCAGQIQFAENKVQELLLKQEQRPDLSWHLIGHLQSNKVKYIIDKISMLHSLDSLSLALEIQKRASAKNIILPCLVQVNIADDDQKFGLSEAEVSDFLDELSAYPNLKIKGLMTIGPFLDDSEQMRPVFRNLRLLKEKEQLKGRSFIDLQHLSMGMSNDYQIAIEEGADMVRVGSNIFGARNYNN